MFLRVGGEKVEVKTSFHSGDYVPVGNCAFQCTHEWYRKRGSLPQMKAESWGYHISPNSVVGQYNERWGSTPNSQRMSGGQFPMRQKAYSQQVSLSSIMRLVKGPDKFSSYFYHSWGYGRRRQQWQSTSQPCSQINHTFLGNSKNTAGKNKAVITLAT